MRMKIKSLCLEFVSPSIVNSIAMSESIFIPNLLTDHLMYYQTLCCDMSATKVAERIREKINQNIPNSDDIHVIRGEDLAIINGYVPEGSYHRIQDIIDEYNAEEGPSYLVEDTGEIHISIDVHAK